MGIEPWEVLDSKYLHERARVDICRVNGKTIEPVMLEFGTWVTIVAITKNKEVVLVRQYRHGVQKILLELPGGGVHQEETPLEAAKRELLEETGYTSDTFVQTGIVSPNPCNHNNQAVSFLALNAEKISEQNLDDTEEIQVSLKPLEEAVQWIKSGELLQSLHVSAFFFALSYMGFLD
ncbi:MAG: NUDIX hydrolase [Anaerolineae bacterium]|jgi:ADP-ribose pyrophosphatase|nr:NUDIX hydrolase [Anaerolineae bacterium]MBT7192098.1 NUDIX hydrolase [Anaerolineae bacterium]MBT7990174.1 NUDIX hydrolase [Anaerolineae bacterium]